MHISKNRNVTLRATIRTNTFTLPLRIEPNVPHSMYGTWPNWNPTRIVMPVREWALFENHSSDANHRPHPRRQTLKNPRTITRQDREEWYGEYEHKYGRRGHVDHEKFLAREHLIPEQEPEQVFICEDCHQKDDDPNYHWIICDAHPRDQWYAPWENALLGLPENTAWTSYSPRYHYPGTTRETVVVEHVTPNSRPEREYRESISGLQFVDASMRSKPIKMRTSMPTRVIERRRTWETPAEVQNPDGKYRVWEIAREAGVDSKTVIEFLCKNGEYVCNAQATVYPHVARQVIKDLGKA